MYILFVILCVILIISLFSIKEKNNDLQKIRNDLELFRKENRECQEKICSYENREKSIEAREIELELLIETKVKETESDLYSKRRKCEFELAKKIQQANKEILSKESESLKRISRIRDKTDSELNKRQKAIQEKESSVEVLLSNLTAIPYMAGIIADYDTRGLEILAKKLDWGNNQERAKEVASIREIRKYAEGIIAQSKEAQYQLEYAIKMFPALSDFLETDYNQLPVPQLLNISTDNYDCVQDYLTKEEYSLLSSSEKNQLALDRYRESHRKTNWQIGRDYELYVGYKYEQKGYKVDYFGSNNGLEDLGRDLIAKSDEKTLIIQCKFWSSNKLIHENHVNQLYGTMICYCLENNLSEKNVQGVLVTNIKLSDTAKRFADYLGISYVENFSLGDYPCIKCNINRSPDGQTTKIYHLPFDQQYDSCIINSPGEFFAMTVAEAEAAGFRRAFRWHSDN